MALNWTMLSPARSPIPLPHELTIRTIDSGAELTLLIPDTPPSSAASSSGGSGGSRKLKETGRLWLTDQRLIFVADQDPGKASTLTVPGAPPSPSAPLESLSIPHTHLLSTKFEQPYFGANYLSLELRPVPGGGLTEGTRAEVRLRDKGIFEFAGALEKTRERTIYMRRQQQADEEDNGLPSYAPPTPTEVPGPSASPRVPEDNPPGYDD